MKNSEEIKIRQAKIEDIEQLCNIRNNEKLFREYLEECDGERAYFLLAEIGKKVVGFGLVYLDATKKGKKKSHLPKLSDLYVIEEYRRKGVATALIKARETIAKQYGYLHIYVSIDPSESLEMISLANKLSYIPLQPEPYLVSAIYYDNQGQPYQKQYFRIDFKKDLR
ncbi:MAG: GNAT family N-acetyltransferase [Acidobacteria bacterium]|nr:GNAT family N-acetyltransferase [Acidobacteriota bacterium]